MKTHYEKLRQFNALEIFDFGLQQVRQEIGNEFSYSQMVESHYGRMVEQITGSKAHAYLHYNMLYHLNYFELYYKRVYQITNSLAEMLINTHLNKVPIQLLKAPYPEILLEIPLNLLDVIVPPTGRHRVYNIYVYLKEHTEHEKELRILVAGLSNENSCHELDDGMFYFRINTKDGDTDLQKVVEREIDNMRKDTHLLKVFNNDIDNLSRIKKIFDFVLNCLLYITGADCDVKYVDRSIDLKRKFDNAKSDGKRKKWQRMIHNAGLPRYMVGNSIILSRIEREAYESIRNGQSGKHTVRTIVQGHWRNQACGEGRALRRATWIKPFWRGPEFGELISKKHKVV